MAKLSQIIDASIVSIPNHRNSRKENSQIKDGHTPDHWHDANKWQKDVDARSVKKNGKNYYGYNNHVTVDVKYKLIRGYAVTDAAVHDSQVFEVLLDKHNSSPDVYADSAYRPEDSIERLEQMKYREHLQHKG